jgi:hypothetical protein
MSKCLKCKLSHDPRMQCQFVETDEATPVAPAPTAEVTIVNISNIVDAFGRLMASAVEAQNSILSNRVNLLGADYVRNQESGAMEVMTAAVGAVTAAAMPYVARLAEAELAVIEARTRNEVARLDIEASKLRDESRLAAASRHAASRHAARRR